MLRGSVYLLSLAFALECGILTFTILMDKRYNIRYKGDLLHENLSIEECSGILQDFADRFYNGKEDEINPSFIEMEELTNG